MHSSQRGSFEMPSPPLLKTQRWSAISLQIATSPLPWHSRNGGNNPNVMNEQTVMYPYHGLLFSHKKELLSERVLGPDGSAYGWPVFCGFMTSQVQERLHKTSPSDYESTFVKAGDSETRKGLGSKKQQERDEAGLLWLTEKSENKGVLQTSSEG